MAIRSIATAGMVSDTSLYNIDGACVVGGTNPIAVGRVVTVTSAQPIDGHKVVAQAGAADAVPYGVVVKSGYETPDGTARAKEAVNVMTHGRIWVVANPALAPVFGRAVFVATDGSINTTGTATGWTFAGGFVTAAQSPDGLALVEVQVKQSSVVVPPAA